MRNVIVAWCKINSAQFETHVPLEFIGNRNRKLNFETNIDVIFIEGYELLDKAYRNRLYALGFHLQNANKIYLNLASKYNALNQF